MRARANNVSTFTFLSGTFLFFLSHGTQLRRARVRKLTTTRMCLHGDGRVRNTVSMLTMVMVTRVGRLEFPNEKLPDHRRRTSSWFVVNREDVKKKRPPHNETTKRASIKRYDFIGTIGANNRRVNRFGINRYAIC